MKGCEFIIEAIVLMLLGYVMGNRKNGNANHQNRSNGRND